MKQESLAVLRIETRWRMRQRWHRAEKSLILQGKAICRGHTGGDKDAANDLFKQIINGGFDGDINLSFALMPFLSAIANFQELRKSLEKELATLARDLPAADWITATPGIALPSLAAIVGEAGDLSNYATHSKLWRRMGMAPFTKNGIAKSGKQWKVEGGLNADDWSEFGYSPVRRSVMFVIEDSMTKAKGPYREVYLARKEYLRQRAEGRGLTVAPAAKIPAKRRNEFVSLGHIDQDSKRYMGKRLLRDLWRAWRRASQEMPYGAIEPLPAAEISDAPSGAGRATPKLPAMANSGMLDRGEALFVMPARAKDGLPPRKSRKAPPGAVSANGTVPKGQGLPADTKNSDASARQYKPNGHVVLADAVSAMRTAPKGQKKNADTKNTKAPKGAGQAKKRVPAKAASDLPDHKFEDAAS
jgi:hypothetical protein